MAGWFAQHLLHNPVYRDAFELVSFAVLECKENGSSAAFERAFAGA